MEPVFLTELNRRKPGTMEALAQLWYRANGGYSGQDWRRRAASHYDTSRYHLLNPVSYTHLDVYKRQCWGIAQA